MRTLKQGSLKFVLLVAATLATNSQARAELQVLPSRILLSEEQKTAQVSLMHKGSKSARYRVDALPFKMKTDGSIEVLRDPTKAERSAVDFFRYSPRQVTVDPNSEQVVRLQLKWPEEAIADADYYAYLSIETIEEADESNAVRPSANAQALPTEPPVLVPVIVRRGSPELKVTLENFKLTPAGDKTYSYSVDVVKSGTAILQADFVLLYQIEGVEKPLILAQSNAVSSTIDKRSMTQSFPLEKFQKGKIVLEVRESLTDGGKLLASISHDTVAPVSSPTPSRQPSSTKRRGKKKSRLQANQPPGGHTLSSTAP